MLALLLVAPAAWAQAEEPAKADAPAPTEAQGTSDGAAAQNPPAEAPAAANADQPPEGAMGSVPGSPRPPGMSLDQEAPPVPATVGGRAPSFSAPADTEGQWSFRMGGRLSGYQTIGIGRKPAHAPVGYSGRALHMPAWVAGRQPYWAGAGLTLYFTYGNPLVSANLSYYVDLNGSGYRGYWSPQNGPIMGQAYLAFTPPAFGKWQLQAKVGSFTDNYGGVGQWGWGVFGPLLATRGYGEVIIAQRELSPNWQLSLSEGFSGVPALPEDTQRGDYTGWVENNVSSIVYHAHAGLTYKYNHSLRFHYASSHGIDERRYLTTSPRDGRMDVYLVDAHTRFDPYGAFGLAAAVYDFKNGLSVNDGIWWGVDWTQGGRELISKFVGSNGTGDGRFAAVSAQWDFSLARMLWYPRSFDGRAPDVRGSLAGLYEHTMKSDDPIFKDGANGISFAAEVEYAMLSWLGATVRGYGESRDAEEYAWLDDGITLDRRLGRYQTYSVTTGLVFRTDWASQDTIDLAYTRRFYNHVSDNNPAHPYDRHVVTLGATLSF